MSARSTRKVSWSGVFTSMFSGRRCIQVAVPLDYGIGIAVVNIESLNAHTWAARIEPDAKIIIVDRNGQMLFHTDRALAALRPNWRNREPIAQAMAGRLGASRYRSDGLEMLGSTAVVAGSGWIVLAEQDWRDASRPIGEVYRGVASVVVIVALLAILTAALFARRLGGPIDDLSLYAMRVGEGDYAASRTVQRYREFEELSDGIGAMAQAVEEREGQLVTSRSKLVEAVAELERSNKELQQFAYVASHDLQEPLRMVTSYVQLLQKRYKGKLDSDADDFIEYAADGAIRMQRMILDLLEYSRVQTKGSTPKCVDAASAIESAVASLRHSIEESGADVTWSELPLVSADIGQLSRLFQNLIGNAIKFRREGIAPEVRVSAVLTGDMWEIAVADNGIGIDSAHAEEVFDIFRRLESPADYPGTGIGLAVSRRIVERHGGTIRVESELGIGSTFLFTLPAVCAEPDAGPDKV